MAEPDDFPPMREAIAAVDLELIYREAKRQYEALIRMRSMQNESTELSQQDLPQFYRSLFDDATQGLDEWEKHRLLTICFAYKTKSQVLYYLDLLDDDAFPWITPFKQIVSVHAKDTLFKDVTHSTNDAASDEDNDIPELDLLSTFKLQYKTQKASEAKDRHPSNGAPASVLTGPSRNSSNPYGLRSKVAVGRATPVAQPGPYFVVTTLPLAFPKKFLGAFASHAPLSYLTVPSILSYPSALQLGLNGRMKSMLCANLPNFLEQPSTPQSFPALYAQARRYAEEDASWAAFYDHLLSGRETLTAVDGGQLPIDEGDGYGNNDLEMWLAGWRAERQSVGMKEKGQETLLKIQLRLSTSEIAGDAEEPVDDLDIEGYSEQVDKRRKRVRWSEDLITVEEIPPRAAKKKKKRARKNW